MGKEEWVRGEKKKSKEKHGRVLFLPTAVVECGSKQDYCDTEWTNWLFRKTKPGCCCSCSFNCWGFVLTVNWVWAVGGIRVLGQRDRGLPWNTQIFFFLFLTRFPTFWQRAGVNRRWRQTVDAKKEKKKDLQFNSRNILQFYTFPKTTTKRGTEGGGGAVCYAEGLKLREKSNSVCGVVGGEV